MAIIQGNAHKSSVSGFYPKTLNGSLRFNDDDSPYLARTPASAGNQQTWTFSFWCKKITSNWIADANTGGLRTGIYFTTDQLFVMNFNGAGYDYQVKTTQLFRDPSAWYHIVVVYDSTNAVSSDRIKIYVNGKRVTAFATEVYPSLNFSGRWNSAIAHTIGSTTSGTGNFDGYLAEIFHIDGTAHTASDFGETKNGVWVPKNVTSTDFTMGTNGFYLKFADNANDSSANGNNWTANNITSDDYVSDSPTDNYATWNPIGTVYGNVYSGTFSEGNLKHATSGNPSHVFATMALPSSGKTYWECTPSSLDTARTYVGVVDPTDGSTTSSAASYSFYSKAVLNRDGSFWNSSTSTHDAIYTSYTNGDTIMLAWDGDTGKLWFGKNGTWMNSGNPSAGTGQIVTLDTSKTWLPYAGYNSTWEVNFGQQPFTYTPPA